MSTGFFILTAAAMSYFAVAGHGPAIVVAALAAVFFAYVAARNIIKMMLRRPFLVITDDGLRLSARVNVSWDEVVSVGVFRGTSGYAWKGFIGIELHDP